MEHTINKVLTAEEIDTLVLLLEEATNTPEFGEAIKIYDAFEESLNQVIMEAEDDENIAVIMGEDEDGNDIETEPMNLQELKSLLGTPKHRVVVNILNKLKTIQEFEDAKR